MHVLIVDGLQMKFHGAYLMALTVLSPGYRAVVSLLLLEMPHLLLVSCFAHKRAVPGGHPQLPLRCLQWEPSCQPPDKWPPPFFFFYILQMLIPFIFLLSFMSFQSFLCDIPIFQHVDKVLWVCGMVYFKGTLIFLTSF